MKKMIYGVWDIFDVNDSEDIIVIGKVDGAADNKMQVNLINYGDDDKKVVSSNVVAIDIKGKEKTEVKDCIAALRIANGKNLKIKTGTVIYSGEPKEEEIYDSYIQAMGEGYITHKHLELSDAEYGRMSLTDLSEVRRLFKWLIDSNKEHETEQIIKTNKSILDRIGQEMAKKILETKEMYTLVSTYTGEPHMFSMTYSRGDGSYSCTPPDVMLITKAYVSKFENRYNPEKFEVVKIEGEIKDFLGTVFYLNGACGVSILYEGFGIDAEMLVDKPDYSGVPEIQIPVTNPDLERWLLLIGQLGGCDNEDAKKICSLYLSFMFKEMAKARFLVPMKMEAQMSKPDENGKCTITEGGTMQIAVMPGKAGRDSVRMFTDWKRFRMVYPESEGWGGMVQKASEAIETFDCAINATEFSLAGCYLSREAYEDNVKPYI